MKRTIFAIAFVLALAGTAWDQATVYHRSPTLPTSMGTANQIPGMDAAASGTEWKTVSGTSNRVTVTHGANSITLSGPQDLHTGATPDFVGLTLSGLSATEAVVTDSSKGLTTLAYTGAISLRNNMDLGGADDGGLRIATSKAFTVSKTMTLTSADDTSVSTLPVGAKTLAANDASNWTLATQASGDLLVASGATAFGLLPDVAAGSVLVSGGVGAAPAYSASPSLTGLTLSGLTASRPVGTGASQDLVSLDVTGTGSVVLATGPSIAGATMTGNLLFTDNSFDIGATGATRPRSAYFSQDIYLENLGADTNSGKFYLKSRKEATTQTASIQALYGADPYLRISVPNDSGVETSLVDLHDTVIAFTNDNTVDIGADGANRPKNLYLAGTINKVTITQPAASADLTIADGKAFTLQKSMSFTAADDTGVYTFPTGAKTLMASDYSNAGAAPTWNQNTTGSAATLTTPRAINGVNFDGSAAITVPVNNTDDTTTNATVYPLWSTTAGGNYAANVSTTKLSFNPSSGTLTLQALNAPGGTIDFSAIGAATTLTFGDGNVRYFSLTSAVGAPSLMFRNVTASTDLLAIAAGGTVTIPNLAGIGTRTVVVDANGVLSAP